MNFFYVEICKMVKRYNQTAALMLLPPNLTTVLLLIATLMTVGVLVTVMSRKMGYGQDEDTYAKGEKRIGCSDVSNRVKFYQNVASLGQGINIKMNMNECINTCQRLGHPTKPDGCSCKNCETLCKTEWSDFRKGFIPDPRDETYDTSPWLRSKSLVFACPPSGNSELK
jgi:hypothetical protein